MDLRLLHEPEANASICDDGQLTLAGASEVTVAPVDTAGAHAWLAGARLTLADDGGLWVAIGRTAAPSRQPGWVQFRVWHGAAAGRLPLCTTCGGELLPHQPGDRKFHHANPKHLHEAIPRNSDGLMMLSLPSGDETRPPEPGQLSWLRAGPGWLVEDYTRWPS